MTNRLEIDPLTGLANRPQLRAVLAERLDRGDTLALALIDLDRFKHFNMHNGHLAGDAALRALTSILESLLHSGDAIYRFAGQQFVVTIPADLPTALQRSELLRAAVEDRLTPAQPEHCGDPHCLGPVRPLTVSIGVVALVNDITTTLEAAQQALERAKWAGRNRVSP